MMVLPNIKAKMKKDMAEGRLAASGAVVVTVQTDTLNSNPVAESKSSQSTTTTSMASSAGEVAALVPKNLGSPSTEGDIGTANSKVDASEEDKCKISQSAATTSLASSAGEVAALVPKNLGSPSTEGDIGTANSKVDASEEDKCKISQSAATTSLASSAGEVAALVPKNKTTVMTFMLPAVKQVSVAASKTYQSTANTLAAANKNNSRSTVYTHPRSRRMHSAAASWNSSKNQDLFYTHNQGPNRFPRGQHPSYSTNYGQNDDCEIVSYMNDPGYQYATRNGFNPHSNFPVRQHSYLQDQVPNYDRFGQPFYQPRSRQPLPQNQHIYAQPQFPALDHLPAQNHFDPQRQHLNQSSFCPPSSSGRSSSWHPYSSRKRKYD